MVLYLPDTYVVVRKAGSSWSVERRAHGLRRVPVEPLVYKQRLGKPFGNSRISPSIQAHIDAAARTIYRSEIGAEFYSTPQRYVLGADESQFLDENGNPQSSWDYLMTRMLAIAPNDSTDAETPIVPTVGQFPQMSQQPHVDQLRSIATLFAGEASLPVSELGIIHDNPSSAEAIEAAERGLIIEAESTNRGWSASWRNIAQNAYLLANDVDEVPEEIRNIRPKWRDASQPSKAARSAAVVGLVEKGILPPDSDVTLELLGFDETDIQRIQADRRRTAGRDAVQALVNRVNGNAATA
jgi:hypothetical protein